MSAAEAQLAEEIARLEAELEKTRLESKLRHLKAELNAVEGVLNEDEYLVIQDLVHSGQDDDASYEEYTDNSYDEYEEEYVEEYEEEIVEEEYTDEYEEEYSIEEEDEVMVNDEQVPEQAPTRAVYGDLQKAHGNLRKAPASSYQRKEAEAAVVTQAPESAMDPPKAAAPKPAAAPKAEPKPRVKSKVRPPPGQGGKPVPRQDPELAAKPVKKNPLSRLLQRSNKSVEAKPDTAAPSAVSAPKKVIPRKAAPKKTAPKPPEAAVSKKPVPPAAGGPFKRRIIPNLQPSPAGEESIFEQLLGQKLITNPQLHKSSTKGCVKDQELVGLYFGAVWKSDCKRFNAILKDFYYNTAQQNNLEIIYISADRSLIEFKDCYATMPFLAMPAGTTSLKNDLTKALKINEMPALVILDNEGNVVTVQGVQKLLELEKGNVEQANQLIDRWKKTRPIPISEVKQDHTLLHGTMERGTVYWQS